MQEDHANSKNADEEQNEDNKDDREFQWCNNSPCVWAAKDCLSYVGFPPSLRNHKAMLVRYKRTQF
jgi:hypothetical protein